MYDRRDDYQELTPYKRAGADLDRRGSLANSAVSRRDDSVSVEQNTTAEVRAALGQADNVGELCSRSSGSTDDVLTIDRKVTLRLAGLQAEWLGRAEWLGNRCCHRDNGHRQGEGEGDEGRHCSELEGRAS